MTAVLRLLSRRGEPSRRARRILVVLAVIGIVALPLILMAWPYEAGLLGLLLLVAIIVVPVYALQEFRRNIIRRANADERERQRRDDAYRLSYRIIELGVVLVPVLFIFRGALARIPGWDWFNLWLPLYGLVIFLPYMVFAWREPDIAD
jgi:hypothetical protein